MTLTRMVCILAGALAIMLAVVILRAERTRLDYDVSQLDRRADGLVQQLRAEELELARLKHPALIRARVAEMRLGTAPETPDKSAKKKPR